MPSSYKTEKNDAAQIESQQDDEPMPMQYPAWLASVLMHAAIIFLLLLIWQQHNSSVNDGEETWNTLAGLHVKESSRANDVAESAPNETTTESATNETVAETNSENSENPNNSDAPPIIGSSGVTITQQSLPATATQNATGYTLGDGTRATIKVFGASGSGHRFVFVFDRSDSMNAGDKQLLRRAKKELVQAIESLDELHQFDLIVYNDTMTSLFSGMSFATEVNRATATRFVERIDANGGTRHETPLASAIRMKPDVIFFLTDAESVSDISAAELDRLSRALGGSAIQMVQFGNFRSPRLERLVQISGGATTRVPF